MEKRCKWCKELVTIQNIEIERIPDECDSCWELRARIEQNPIVACRIAEEVTKKLFADISKDGE